MADNRWGIRGLRPEQEYTDEELDAFAEFSEASVRGERPSVEAQLAKYPEYAGTLRPLLEAARRFDEQAAEFRRRWPDFTVWELFGARPGRKV